MRGVRHLIEELIELLIKLLRREEIPGPAVDLQFNFGKVIMPAALNVGQKVTFFITGTDANQVRTSQLASGASLKVSVDNSAVASIAQDATPQPAPDGGPSIASGVLTATGAGSANISAAVMNADGTVGPQATDVVVVSAAAPGPATAITIVFGSPA